ncbi:17312_t:CDS:2 [Funneliformis geosporum]|uniref:17312_t:CDS:1 n=1 Tax=Funneliformis geosporum TaxID=1117311 RepID=A0A9W4SVF9_9GLOM|nr:17312_t:CDS:2 [Funneliformis geosporum]
MPELINANPTIYIPSKTSHRIITAKDEDENIEDIIDSQEVFELNVTQLEHVSVDDDKDRVIIEFTPTIPHCSMATLIGLCIRVRLLRSLPERFKVDINVRKGTHQSEQAVNKQLNDKERVAAALENAHLLEVVNQCLTTANSRSIK